jgi:hypothetical protein
MPKLVLKELNIQRPDNETLQIIQRANKEVESGQSRLELVYIDPVTQKRYVLNADDIPQNIYQKIYMHLSLYITNSFDYTLRR